MDRPPDSTPRSEAVATGEPTPAAASPDREPASPPRPVRTEETDAAHAAAAASIGVEPLPPLRSPGGASALDLPGRFVAVVGPKDAPPLDRFHAALRRLAEGRDEDGKVRVAMYGASGTAADLATGYLRTYLQTRFGDGGVGFVPLVPLSRWYRHNEVVVEASRGWTKEHAQLGAARKDGYYGLLGASFATTGKKRWAAVSPRKGRHRSIVAFEIWYLAQPGGGSFHVEVDGRRQGVVETAALQHGPGYHRIEVTPDPHALRIETLGDGEVRLFGAVLESEAPGIVVDTLGIDGTRAANQLVWDEAVWADNLRRRAPDLVVLSYGTNESVDTDESLETYRQSLREVLTRHRRAAPEASCLLLLPADYPIVTDGGVEPRPRLLEIVEAQREIGPELGCDVWDGMAFMGGPGSMAQWVSAEPPLARDDYLHFNRRGAARKAQALADALMLGYDAASMSASP